MAKTKVFFTLDDGRRGAITMEEANKEALIAAFVHNASGPAGMSGVPIAARNITVAQAIGALAATATVAKVSDELMRERVETACMDAHWNPGNPCEFARKTPDGQLHCGKCGCNLSSTEKLLPNLARLEEKRDQDGNVVIGCKHPERTQGKGWKR